MDRTNGRFGKFRPFMVIGNLIMAASILVLYCLTPLIPASAMAVSYTHLNYNHPSIVCWGVSNEITISTKDKADMLDNHRVLNELCHKMDPTRLTTLACYAMCLSLIHI